MSGSRSSAESWEGRTAADGLRTANYKNARELTENCPFYLHRRLGVQDEAHR